MSEHIYEDSDMENERYHVIPFGSMREEIVRCKDCKHRYGCLHLVDNGDDDMRRCKATPDGFCSWGERETINKIDDSVIDDRFCSLFDRYIIDGICAWEERKEK